MLSLLVSDVIDTGHQPGEQPSIEGLCQGISVGDISVCMEEKRQEKREEGEKRKIKLREVRVKTKDSGGLILAGMWYT